VRGFIVWGFIVRGFIMRPFSIKTVFLLVALSLAIGAASCGKKAPPQPPDGLFRALQMFGK
jgi:hypothetical protein